MALELEGIANKFSLLGYNKAANRLLQLTAELLDKGLLPEGFPTILGGEPVPHELMERTHKIASLLEVHTKQDDIFLPDDNKMPIFLMTKKWGENSGQYTRVLHSSNSWIKTELGSGGIVFEANIEPRRREEIGGLGVEVEHIVGVGVHTEEESQERALQLIEDNPEYRNNFETTYFIGKGDNVVKLSLVPIALDSRPDIFHREILTLGMKRVESRVTRKDFALIDSTLSIFEDCFADN